MDQGGTDLPSMSYAELSKFDGVASEKIYFSLKGIVFDVSGSDFYKPGGPYHYLAGHEASVPLAKMSKETEYLDQEKYKWDECLDENDKIMLENWFSKISEKYPKVAKIASQ
jgi:membrane-associated progesterone receptor component